METYSQFSMKNKVWFSKRKVHIREADWAQFIEGFVSDFKKLSLYLLESLSGYKFRNDMDQFAFYFNLLQIIITFIITKLHLY